MARHLRTQRALSTASVARTPGRIVIQAESSRSGWSSLFILFSFIAGFYFAKNIESSEMLALQRQLSVAYDKLSQNGARLAAQAQQSVRARPVVRISPPAQEVASVGSTQGQTPPASSPSSSLANPQSELSRRVAMVPEEWDAEFAYNAKLRISGLLEKSAAHSKLLPSPKARNQVAHCTVEAASAQFDTKVFASLFTAERDPRIQDVFYDCYSQIIESQTRGSG